MGCTGTALSSGGYVTTTQHKATYSSYTNITHTGTHCGSTIIALAALLPTPSHINMLQTALELEP